MKGFRIDMSTIYKRKIINEIASRFKTSSKDPMKRMKKISYRLEENICIYLSDKSLVSKTYKLFSKLNNYKSKQAKYPIKKMGED